jgi:hypothetical protein
MGDPFDGYMGLGRARRAVAPPPSDITVSIWAMGSVDHEHRTGTANGVDLGSDSTSWTGIGGGDLVKLGVFNRTDAFVIGALGSDTFTQSSTAVGAKTKATTPGTGAYLAYINGAGSIDFAFTANFTDADTNTAGVTTSLKATSLSYTPNLRGNRRAGGLRCVCRAARPVSSLGFYKEAATG